MKINKKYFGLLILILLLLILTSHLGAVNWDENGNNDYSALTNLNNSQLTAGLQSIKSMVNDFIRLILSWIAIGMMSIVNIVEKAIDSIISFDVVDNFAKNKGIMQFHIFFKVITYSAFAILVAVFGIRTFTNPKETSFDKVLKRLTIASAFIFLVIPFSNSLYNWTYKYVFNEYSNEMPIGTEVILENTIDVEESIKTINSGSPNAIKLSDKFINDGEINTETAERFLTGNSYPNQEVNFESFNGENEKYKNMVLGVTDTGQYITGQLGSGIWEWDEYLYRYQTDYLVIIMELLAIAIGYIFMGIKFARMLLFELPVAVFSAGFFALTDLTNKKTIESGKVIINNILGVAISLSLLDFYTQVINVLNTGLTNTLAIIISFFGITIGLISGSIYIQKMINYDSGMEDGKAGVLSAMAGMQAIKGIGSGISNLVKGSMNAGKGAKKMGSKMLDNTKDNVKQSVLDNQDKVASDFAGQDFDGDASNFMGDEEPTANQMTFADDIGISNPEDYTRTGLSKAINDKLSEEPTSKDESKNTQNPMDIENDDSKVTDQSVNGEKQMNNQGFKDEKNGIDNVNESGNENLNKVDNKVNEELAKGEQDKGIKKDDNENINNLDKEAPNETNNLNETPNETNNLNETPNEANNLNETPNETNNLNETPNETNNLNETPNEANNLNETSNERNGNTKNVNSNNNINDGNGSVTSHRNQKKPNSATNLSKTIPTVNSNNIGSTSNNRLSQKKIDQPTKKQLNYANNLGISNPENYSKADLSSKITETINKKKTLGEYEEPKWDKIEIDEDKVVSVEEVDKIFGVKRDKDGEVIK